MSRNSDNPKAGVEPGADSATDPRDRVIAIVESFPEAKAIPAMGVHLKLAVRDKGFGWYMENHHGNGHLEINCKALPGVAQALVESDPIVYHIPKYVGHKGWAGIWVDEPSVDWTAVRDLLYEAYTMAAPKSLLRQIREG